MVMYKLKCVIVLLLRSVYNVQANGGQRVDLDSYEEMLLYSVTNNKSGKFIEVFDGGLLGVCWGFIGGLMGVYWESAGGLLRGFMGVYWESAGGLFRGLMLVCWGFIEGFDGDLLRGLLGVYWGLLGVY